MGLFDDDFDNSEFNNDDGSFGFGDDSLDFGNDNSGFEDSSSSGGSLFDDSSTDSNPLTDGSLFDTGDSNDMQPNDGLRLGGEVPTQGGSKKTALIAIAVGVGILIIVFILASVLLKDKKEDAPTGNVTHNITNVDPNSSGNNQGNNGNANDIMNEGQKRNQSTGAQTGAISNGTNDWIKLDNAYNVTFNESYIDSKFVVTEIHHYALKVDPNGNLEVKTELTGSISGYSGTYKLTVPYSKGSKLSIGMTFDVKVQIGDYNGKSVIGDIIF